MTAFGPQLKCCPPDLATANTPEADYERTWQNRRE